MQIYRVEWFGSVATVAKYHQEYYTNPVIAAQRLVDLQAVGYSPILESVCVFVD